MGRVSNKVRVKVKKNVHPNGLNGSGGLDLVKNEICDLLRPFWPIFELIWAFYKPFWTKWFLRVSQFFNCMFCELSHTIYWPNIGYFGSSRGVLWPFRGVVLDVFFTH